MRASNAISMATSLLIFIGAFVAATRASAGVTVSIVAPTNGSTLNAPITVTASASANQGYAVSKVEFFQGAALIGTVTAFPYTINWAPQPGPYTLSAKATAVKGSSTQTATSAPISVTVNAPPTLSWTSPPNEAIFADPATITLSVTANDSDGTITKVEFYDWYSSSNEDVLIATLTQPPYSTVVTGYGPPPSGGDSQIFYFKAIATDNRFARAQSMVQVTVQKNALPTVNLTNPAPNATFTAPANITVSANATDSDGSVTKVEFFANGTLIGTASSTPFATNWSNVSPGTYSLTARATDNLAGSATSSPVSVTVNAAAAKLHFIHTDHLNTPRLVANQSGQTVWRWDQQEPFGVNVPDENPSSLGTFDLPLRLPGQYSDKETNLHYNFFRDYDPAIGRYVQSDPIGLQGGLNTYLYALSPLMEIDPEGLMGNAPGKGPYAPGTGPGISPMQIFQNIASALSMSGTLSVMPYCDGRWMRVGPPRLAPFPGLYMIVGRVPECQCDWICRSCPGGADVLPYPLAGTHTTTAKQVYSGGAGSKADPQKGGTCLCAPPGPQKGCGC